MRKIAVMAGAVIVSSMITMPQTEAWSNRDTRSESLWVIADKYDTTISKMKKTHNDKSEVIQSNQTLDQLLMDTPTYQK